jgi:glucoamylase
VLVDVRFESPPGRPYRVWVRYDPALGNDGDHDRGRAVGATLTVRSADMAGALATAPALRREASSGYLGTRSDPRRDLRANHRLDRRYDATRPGNVVQLARTPLNGLPGRRRLTLALAFSRTERRARAVARAALGTGFAAAARGYAAGWQG